MTNLPPTPLTTTGQRARAGAILSGALGRPSVASFELVEALDLVCASVVRAAGVDPATARMVLAALWEHPLQSAAAAEPRRGCGSPTGSGSSCATSANESASCAAPAASRSPAIAFATGIPYDQIGDLEHGVGIPTLLGLYRLGEALEIPLPLLLDETKTPLEVLRILAGMQQSRTEPPRG